MKGYPLETLRGLRATEEETAQRGLAEAVRAHAQAAEQAARARQARDAHADDTRAGVERELARPLEGTRASDATTLASWRQRRKRELDGLEKEMLRAEDVARARDRDVERAREALASARRERDAIEKHFARWREEERKKAEAKEEADAEDRRRS